MLKSPARSIAETFLSGEDIEVKFEITSERHQRVFKCCGLFLFDKEVPDPCKEICGNRSV